MLEPGGGETAAHLGRITPAIAQNNRVCVYDRAGRGWSEPTDTPQDAAQILTAGVGHDATWFAAQDRLATLSRNTAHRRVDGATHEGLLADREYAAVTARAVVDVVTSIRTAHPLTR